MEDADGFAAFYRAHQRRLRGAVAVTLGDALLADEAVDEGFTRAAERWRHVRDRSSPEGWVFLTSVNWARSWRRKLRRRPTLPVEALDRGHHDPLPDLDVAALLHPLPLQQRQVLVLRYGLGFPVEETAELLGVAPGTVKSATHRARQRLINRPEVIDGAS